MGENGATRAPIIIDMEHGGNGGLAVVLERKTQNVSASEWIFLWIIDAFVTSLGYQH